jgi:FkbM family methyltransferase
MSGFLRFLEKQVMRGLGKGHGTKSIATEVNGIIKLLGDAPVRLCVDIGGNVGAYTGELLARCPEADVHLFEPSATNIAKLTERFGGNERVHLNPVAVGLAPGEAVLHSDSAGSGLGSLTRRNLDHLDIAFDVTEPVRVIRFEEYWRDTLNSATIDILKLDIEGHELDALQGAGAALGATRAVQFEFGGCNIDTRTYFRDFWLLFSGLGFELHRITPFGTTHLARYSERDEVFTTTNYIAINKGLS